MCLRASGICNIVNILRHEILGKCCNILSGSARLESWHHCTPESFWDMQHHKHFEAKNFIQMFCIFPAGSARLESWHNCMPERFWDMQHNKNFRQILYILFGYPGWSPGMTVCLGSSKVCSIQSHRKIDDNFFVFFLKNYPPIFCPFIRKPPLPKNNPTPKISR